jgi:hypothetical protein
VKIKKIFFPEVKVPQILWDIDYYCYIPTLIDDFGHFSKVPQTAKMAPLKVPHKLHK